MKRVLIAIAAALALAAASDLSGQSQARKGWPSRTGKIDVRAHFAEPPKGYGNVPFYWWNGDRLNLERLLDQLELLSDAAVDGLSVSYCHTHPKADAAINANGYGGFGKADPGDPPFFSEEWWSLWNRFSRECAKRGIGLGVDDYVIGWARNGFYVDEVLKSPGFRDYQGRLHCVRHVVEPKGGLDVAIPERAICVVAHPGGIDLAPQVKNGRLKWKSPSDKRLTVYVVSTSASPELHPEYGRRLVDAYFGRFEKKLDRQARAGLNYFFQDELNYDLNLFSWCEDMRSEFKKRNGYDVLPMLPALWDDLGNATPKIRLDYAETLTQLAEERYFKPIFDWHDLRGLIYGCDNNGRGLEPLQYLDYFRATSWHTAPGNDAPAKGSSFIQTKVSSSVAHLYKRPRTWLEAFHSMGWDSNGEWLTHQLDLHMIAGGNLLCLHGLYYSTHGGWWEWAPPCFHFRMPYWPHLKLWLKYAERMSFLLSQGVHVCDAAIVYPTEAMQACPGVRPNRTWEAADALSRYGIDYDFIDAKSIQNAEAGDGVLRVADEEYRILILVDAKAMRWDALRKIRDFARGGGTVIVVGEEPTASNRTGANDPQVAEIVREALSNGVRESNPKSLPARIRALPMTPDFQTKSGEGKVLHRRIGSLDVYMTMHVRRGDEIFLRSVGSVEIWNAWNGTMERKPILRRTDKGVWLRHDAEFNESRVYVVSPGDPLLESATHAEWELAKELPLDGDWNVELAPTMNNKWGDFRLPASDELIGAEAREFRFRFLPEGAASNPLDANPSAGGIFGYAPYMELLTLPASANLAELLPDKLPAEGWRPYCYSWQHGVFDNPGSQGYHGLKGKVDNRFLILDQGGHQIFRTFVYAPKTAEYRIEQEGVAPAFRLLDGARIPDGRFKMKKGWHRLILAYANVPRGRYVLEEKKSDSIDDRQRSAFVVYPADHPAIRENRPGGPALEMKWNRTGRLAFNPFGDAKGLWLYQFQTAPGARKLLFKTNGRIKDVWIDGKPIEKGMLKQAGAGSWILTTGKRHVPGVSTITLTAIPKRGSIGPAFFAEPVKMRCSGGRMSAGNWTQVGALKFYSGGMRYARRANAPEKSEYGRAVLDLGRVNATCEVVVNGRRAGVLMAPPFKIEVGDLLKAGENSLEVLVYSTLSNHYQTIPSAYRGRPESGLLGPAKLLFYKEKAGGVKK